jgi:hypothetical protein
MSSKPQFQLAALLPVVSEAPGRGILPGVSRYTAALPVLYQLDAQPIEQVGPLIQRQMLHGSHSTFVKWIVKARRCFHATLTACHSDKNHPGRCGRL